MLFALTKLDVLRSVGGVQDGFLPRFEGPVDGGALDVKLQLAREQVTQHHGGQEINGVSRLAENLFGAVGEDARRHVVGIILFLDGHTKSVEGDNSGRLKEGGGGEKSRPLRRLLRTLRVLEL